MRDQSSRFCKRCSRHLPLSSFDPKITKYGIRQGYRPQCRECRAAVVAARETAASVNPGGLCRCGCRTPVNPPERPTRHHRYLPGHHRRKSPVEYVVVDCGYKTPCWVWQRAKDGHGYGMTRQAGKAVGAHRMVYERHKGPIPAGLEPDHLCRNPPCVNPDHLEPVTHRVNMLRGDKGKLTREDVQEIRRQEGLVPRKVIAARYGITVSYVCRIVHRQVWTEV